MSNLLYEKKEKRSCGVWASWPRFRKLLRDLIHSSSIQFDSVPKYFIDPKGKLNLVATQINSTFFKELLQMGIFFFPYFSWFNEESFFATSSARFLNKVASDNNFFSLSLLLLSASPTQHNYFTVVDKRMHQIIILDALVVVIWVPFLCKVRLFVVLEVCTKHTNSTKIQYKEYFGFCANSSLQHESKFCITEMFSDKWSE